MWPDDDASEQVKLTSWDISAVNVDEFATSANPGTQEEIPMGRGLGVNQVATTAAGSLTTIPNTLHVEHLAYPIRGDGPWTDQLLDAEAHRTIPATESTTLAAATFTASHEEAGAPPGFSVRMTLADGKPGPTVPVSPTEMSGFPVGLMPWDSPNGLRKNGTEELSVLPVPGCTIILFSPDTDHIVANQQRDLMIVGVN